MRKAPKMAEREFCIRCGECLAHFNVTWLELSVDSGRYYAEGAFPTGHQSQGGFPFGRACAESVVKADGKLKKIGRLGL